MNPRPVTLLSGILLGRAFDAIMQKGYKREYKALKKRLRKQLSSGKVGLEKAANDYVLWFYDEHIVTREFNYRECPR